MAAPPPWGCVFMLHPFRAVCPEFWVLGHMRGELKPVWIDQTPCLGLTEVLCARIARVSKPRGMLTSRGLPFADHS